MSKFNASSFYGDSSLDLRGPQGETGKDGPQGIVGPAGQNGIGAIGPFASAFTVRIEDGTDFVQTNDGRAFVAAPEVDRPFSGLNPLISFVSANDRGFREVDRASGAKLQPALFVAAGQSNSAGGNKGGPNPASPGVRVLNPRTNKWGSSDYTEAPWTFLNPDGNAGNNNIALAAATEFYRRTGRPVFLVYYFVGGTSIDNWVAQGTASPFYAALKLRIAEALDTPELAEISTIDAFIWSQGEEDGQMLFTDYQTRFATLNAQLRNERWCGPDAPVLVTQMSKLHDRYAPAEVLADYATNVDGRVKLVGFRGLNTQYDLTGTGDFTHWLGEDLYKGGVRVCEALLDGKWLLSQTAGLWVGRSSGPATPRNADAIATFDNMINWSSRTDGPGVVDKFTGNGSAVTFALTSYGVVTAVTVDGTTMTFQQSGLSLTLGQAPPTGAAIVVSYRAAVNGPAAVGSISWGYRCYADGNQSYALGYLCATDNTANYSLIGGRQSLAGPGASNSLGWGLQVALYSTYQFAAGRGHTLSTSGQAAVGLFSLDKPGVTFRVGIGPAVGTPRNGLEVDTSGNVNAYNALQVAGTQVVGPRAAGWVAATGTANKAAYATYTGQTAPAAYTPAQAQATDDALKAASQRIKAIEDALRTHGLIS